VLYPPGRSMTFSARPVRSDTRTSRSPATAHRAPPAADLQVGIYLVAE
jgi:hypothetical protein